MSLSAEQAAVGHPLLAVRSPAARLGVAVVQELVDAIVTEVLAPGELLPPEAPLAAQFGVSRTVIRESVKRLEEKGLVTVSQGRGTVVNPQSVWNLLDPIVLSAMIRHDDSLGILDEVSEVRAELEATMAGQAAGSERHAEPGDLEALLQQMIDAIDDSAAFRRIDIAFHAEVMALSGSRLAPSIARTLFHQALESSRYHGNDPEHAFEITIADHRAILDAIERGDRGEATDAMRRHIIESWERRRLPVHRGDR